MRAKAHLGFIDGEVGDTAAKLEQFLARIAVPPVLRDRIVHGLFRQIVLELESDDRQAVDEERDIERALGFIAAVAQLPGNGESVLGEALFRLFVAGSRRAEEKRQIEGAVADARTQNIDCAAPGDFALQPGEELAPGRTVLVERERIGGIRLGLAQEGAELREIDAILAIVVMMIAAAPTHTAVICWRLATGVRRGRRFAGMPRQRGADQAFKAALGGVGAHGAG